MYKMKLKIIRRIIKEASERTVRGLKDETIREEESFSSQFAGFIRIGFEQMEDRFKTKLKVIHYSSRNREQKITGADLGVILDIIGENKKKKISHRTRKSFLAQGKFGIYTNKPQVIVDSKLLQQCDDMLKITSDSFVFIYTQNGIYVIPALSLKNEYKHHKRVDNFFAEFFKCFIGDHKVIHIVDDPSILSQYAKDILHITYQDINYQQSEKDKK